MEYTQSISSKGAKCSVDIAEPKGLCSSRSVHLMVNETVLYVLGVPTWSVSQCEAAMGVVDGRGFSHPAREWHCYFASINILIQWVRGRSYWAS